jgi:hypothetical protein
MTVTSSAVLTVLAIGAIHWFALEARWAKPRISNGYTEYPMPKGLKLAFLVGVPLLIYGAVANLLRPDGEKWVSILLIAGALFCLYFTPATILCSRDRLVSIRWYGIRKVSMNWADVVSVYKNPEDNSITIRDQSNRTIVHTMYNVGRTEFIHQISELPYGFPKLL